MGAPALSSAQILKGLGRKIEKKLENETNRRVERRIDRTIDKSMDKVEQSVEDAVTSDGNSGSSDQQKNAPSNQSSSSAARAVFSGASTNNVQLLDSYTFDLGISYEIHSGKDEVHTTMWFGDADYLGMTADVGHHVFVIMYDGHMISFMQNQKTYMVMSGMVDQIVDAAANEAENSAGQFTINKIGSERVLDYACDIYEIKSDEFHSKLWLAQDAGLSTRNFMGALSSFSQRSPVRLPNAIPGAGGLMLRMEGRNPNDNETIIMEAVAITKEERVINTAEYSRMSGF